jgi:FAD binding domain/Berberine and berberine like
MTDLRVVKIDGADAVLEESVAQGLADSLRGPLLRPGDSDYDEARKVWNGMIDRRPALISRCMGVGDVINSVNFARAHRLLVAVRGGGHNVAGNATCDGGLVIDLSEMKSIRVDPVQRTARAEAGATWGEFDRETQTFGLATPGGQISTTGVAGLTLGGGWGHLARRYGLVSDNLISADLVLADGSFLTVSKTQHPELFWGLRGGGGNFGVVTSLEYQLHQVGSVVGGLVAYPMEKAKEALGLFRDLTAQAPDELASDIVLITMPDGTPVVGMVVCYAGASEEGVRLLRHLKTLTPTVMDTIGPTTYVSAQRLVDDFYPKGLQNYWKSSFLGEISDGAIDTIVRYCANRPSPMCHGLIEHQLGGAVSRIGNDESAFNHRSSEYSFMSIGQCADPSEAAACVRWAREFWEAMQPYSTGGVYVNYLGREADEGADRVKAAYGPEKYQRLVALKNKYDPTNLFRMNQNIKPGA